MATVDAVKSHKIPSSPRRLVTGLASCGLMRDFPPRVRECRGRPIRGRVARRAGARSREPSASMIRHISAKCCGTRPLSNVATVAIGRRHGGCEVAKVAGRCDVCTGQGETSGAVVKHSTEPIGCRVA